MRAVVFARGRLGRRRLGRWSTWPSTSAALVFAVDAFVVGRVGLAGAVSVGSSASRAAASARAVLLSAARALPAAVWAPFALVDLPAAMRALAAFAWADLAGLLRDAAGGGNARSAERRIDLDRQPGLAASGGVRVDRADLGRAVERREGVDERASSWPRRPRSRRRSGPSRRTSSRRFDAGRAPHCGEPSAGRA